MPRQERAVHTREVLVRAAAACFDSTGYAATSLHDIVEVAGVSKGALYFHFGSKELLAEAVTEQSAAAWRQILRVSRARAGPRLQVLINVSHGLAQRIRQDVVFRAGLRLGTAAQGEAAAYPNPNWPRTVVLLLNGSERRGELQAGVDAAQAGRLLAATAVGMEALFRQDHGWLTRPVVTAAWRAALPALVPAERLDLFFPAGATGPPVRREEAAVLT